LPLSMWAEMPIFRTLDRSVATVTSPFGRAVGGA
jgi:hypothetical protein